MIINVDGFKDNQEKEISFEISLPIPKQFGINEKSLDFIINGNIGFFEGIVSFKGYGMTALDLQCARCLNQKHEQIKFDIDEKFIKELSDQVETDEIINTFTGTSIDLTEVIMDNFSLNLPVKYICQGDCNGLCEKCGCNLNLEKCNCSNEVIDERFSALNNLFKK